MTFRVRIREYGNYDNNTNVFFLGDRNQVKTMLVSYGINSHVAEVRGIMRFRTHEFNVEVVKVS